MRTDPLLLTLDEPAAALDALAEQRLVDAYQSTAAEVAATVGGVTIFVTHRMSTVRLADRIVVLDGGEVVEQGQPRRAARRGWPVRPALGAAGAGVRRLREPRPDAVTHHP